MKDSQPQSEQSRLAIIERFKNVVNFDSLDDSVTSKFEVTSEKDLYDTIIKVMSYFPDDAEDLINGQIAIRKGREDISGIRYTQLDNNDLLPYESTRSQVIKAIDALLYVKGMRDDQQLNIPRRGLVIAVDGKTFDSINPGTGFNDADIIKKAYEVIGITEEDEKKIYELL